MKKLIPWEDAVKIQVSFNNETGIQRLYNEVKVSKFSISFIMWDEQGKSIYPVTITHSQS